MWCVRCPRIYGVCQIWEFINPADEGDDCWFVEIRVEHELHVLLMNYRCVHRPFALETVSASLLPHLGVNIVAEVRTTVSLLIPQPPQWYESQTFKLFEERKSEASLKTLSISSGDAILYNSNKIRISCSSSPVPLLHGVTTRISINTGTSTNSVCQSYGISSLHGTGTRYSTRNWTEINGF